MDHTWQRARKPQQKLQRRRAMFAAAREPKELWLIDGAQHQDLHAYAGEEYETRVLRFFSATSGPFGRLTGDMRSYVRNRPLIF